VYPAIKLGAKKAVYPAIKLGAKKGGLEKLVLFLWENLTN